MVKVKHSFKNIKQSPLLELLLANAKKAVKGLQCPVHLTTDSTVTLRIVNNRSTRDYQACCYDFEQTIEQAIINASHTSA